MSTRKRSTKKWPLVFTYRGRVTGKEFAARVVCSSRVLAEQLPDGSLWLSGSEPGWFAAGGACLKEANANLKKLFHGILLDKAEECHDFAEFRRLMVAAFDDADRLVRKEWVDLWIENQDGKLDCTPMERERLPRVVQEETSVWVEVIEAFPTADEGTLETRRTQDVQYAVAA